MPPISRTDLQKISTTRRREAKALLDAGKFDGSYYLMGYAVECALKAAISSTTRRHSFPDKKFATDVHTHDLDRLLALSGLKKDFLAATAANPALHLNWTIVKDWSEVVRYTHGTSKSTATDFYSACTTRANGVLPWIQKFW